MATPQDLLPLQQLIIDLLLSASVQRINFTLAPHTVTGAGFRQVAYALGGIIDIAVDPTMAGRGAAAQYSGGRLVFPRPNYGGTLDEQKHIVHESTHALNDMRGSLKGLATFAQDEAAAYVAGSLFILYEKQRYSVAALIAVQQQDYIFDHSRIALPHDVALTIAEGIKDSPGASVDVDQAIQLMKAVVANPVYQRMHITMATPMTDSGLWKR
jgi:hypothetical protein